MESEKYIIAFRKNEGPDKIIDLYDDHKMAIAALDGYIDGSHDNPDTYIIRTIQYGVFLHEPDVPMHVLGKFDSLDEARAYVRGFMYSRHGIPLKMEDEVCFEWEPDENKIDIKITYYDQKF